MIVSFHVTHTSAGGVEGLDRIITGLEENVEEHILSCPEALEYVVVRTCNRFEAYVAADSNGQVREMFSGLARDHIPEGAGNVHFILEDDASIKHLFRVICGLESLIVGEDQIQHQIRDSYIAARAGGHAKSMLSYLFDHALTVGKRVRSETSLNKGAVSVGSAAVELAESRLGTLSDKIVTILGAGDMATVIAKNLVGKGPKTVIVSNRTFHNAMILAEELGGTALTWDRMHDALADSDLILVATSAPHPVVHYGNALDAVSKRGGRPLLLIDVSVPRNVEKEVGEIPGVSLETMDSLQTIAMDNVARRTAEISDAEHIIKEELAKMEKERAESTANELIRGISIKLSGIKERELAEARSRLSTADPEEVLDDFSRVLLNKLTSELYINMRKASRSGDLDTCRAARILFGLEDE
ncbi:MAG: glutamyl-tRNA reductase [Candidatus Methanomethylophilaceae archaeon]|nr:glutamyl-tRNA reductase [Candidatus Methanomethylophilaceae archaeon]